MIEKDFTLHFLRVILVNITARFSKKLQFEFLPSYPFQFTGPISYNHIAA